MQMTKKQFHAWRIINGYTIETLAKKLDKGPSTISSYISDNYYPTEFLYALKGLELENNLK